MVLCPPDTITLEDWNRCAPHIEAALSYSHGTHDLADVYREIEGNFATLWPFETSAVVTQITNYPKFTGLNFWLAGGDLDELLSVEPGIVAWGASHGCTRVSIFGRQGWARVLKKLGYRPAVYPLFREI